MKRLNLDEQVVKNEPELTIGECNEILVEDQLVGNHDEIDFLEDRIDNSANMKNLIIEKEAKLPSPSTLTDDGLEIDFEKILSQEAVGKGE